jgi:hypothetical protein
MITLSSYPRSESTNISMNSMSVILGLNPLQQKRDKIMHNS